VHTIDPGRNTTVRTALGVVGGAMLNPPFVTDVAFGSAAQRQDVMPHKGLVEVASSLSSTARDGHARLVGRTVVHKRVYENESCLRVKAR
jgi:hypothetical protein